MIKYLIFGLLVLLGSWDSSNPAQDKLEADAILAFSKEKNLSLKKKMDRMVMFSFMKSFPKGSGQAIQYPDIITVKYEGRLLNDLLFDEEKEPIDFTLRNLIPAWKEVLVGRYRWLKNQDNYPHLKMGYHDSGQWKYPSPCSALHSHY